MFMMQITEKLKEINIYQLLLILCLSFFIEHLAKHYNFSFQILLDLWQKKFNYNISFHGIKAYDKYGCKDDKYSLNATPGFLALNNFLINQLRNGKMVNSHKIREITYQNTGHENSSKLWFQLAPQTVVHLKNSKDWKDVYFAIKEKHIQNGEKSYGIHEITKVELQVMSNLYTVSELMKKCDEIFRVYEDEKQGRTTNELFICRFLGSSKTSNKLNFDITPFDTNCNIDNLYFEEKDKVMNYIDFFNKNKDWYTRQGRPYTLGICTHGPPGCGKTSFEKALSVFLNRHLIVIDFEKIKTEEELHSLFFSQYIGPYCIPNHKRLYVFPDIDKTTDILYKPEYRKTPIESAQPTTMEKILLHKINNHENGNTDNKTVEIDGSHTNIINLSQILNIFDGLLERTGQIFIMSANHPEKLDPAIVRPGRVDCTIHFKEFSTELVKKFINSFFRSSAFLPNDFFDSNYQELHHKFCPSKLFELCIECNENPSKLKKLLLHNESTVTESSNT
jgi:hypothetical protein